MIIRSIVFKTLGNMLALFLIYNNAQEDSKLWLFILMILLWIVDMYFAVRAELKVKELFSIAKSLLGEKNIELKLINIRLKVKNKELEVKLEELKVENEELEKQIIQLN